jgi:hypothetical protein
MKIFQSRINGELFIAYEVYRKDTHIKLTPTNINAQDSWFSCLVTDDINLGVLIETRDGYAGIFKSFDSLYRQAEYVGEL